MVVEFRQQKKKQKTLLIVGVAVILITAGVLYFGFFREQKLSFVVEVGQEEFIQEVTIDTTVFDNPFFTKDKPFIDVSAFDGDVGRENPFIPF